MKNILITGSSGQIGSELMIALRRTYGQDHVIASDIKPDALEGLTGPFKIIDVTNRNSIYEVAKSYCIDTIIHLASLLSAKSETNPAFAWELNMGGLMNALEVANELNCQFFTPSSIGAFGPESPKDRTPQVTIQRPKTMYGINKVAGELLCDYYYHKFGLDTRGLRLPGLVSYVTPPGGGTTDYAVEMYFEAIRQKEYTSYIAQGTFMDMMYMPDAIDSIIQLMEADPHKLIHRNAYNVSAMSADPETFALEIRKHIPDFRLSYLIDPIRQQIAESWPNSIDTSAAELEWNFKPKYSIESMTRDMLSQISLQLV
jgi:nucleoside-diphosphate-sugar epimerase